MINNVHQSCGPSYLSFSRKAVYN